MSDGALRKISRVIFWRYRRGGWQYDILCFVILLFIFLVPRSVLDGSYFKDQGTEITSTRTAAEPQSGNAADQGKDTPEDKQDPARN